MIVYGAICSLDGYIEDTDGKFDWAMPSEELHAFVNDQERGIDTYLYGRRMYETMVFWETVDDPDPVMQDYAQVWRAAEKIVVSTTLTEVRSERTRIERDLVVPDGRVSIGGAGLAASAFERDLIDEIHLYLCPVIVGGGKPALPDGVRMNLRLQGTQSFDGGFVHLHYAR